MINEYLLYAAGALNIVVAVFHLLFWKLFHWKTELKKTSSLNSAVMQVMNLRLIYLFLLTAFLCFFYTRDLVETRVGNAMLIGFSFLWLGRLVEQFIFFKLNHWIGYAVTFLFIAGTVLFALPVFMK